MTEGKGRGKRDASSDLDLWPSHRGEGGPLAVDEGIRQRSIICGRERNTAYPFLKKAKQGGADLLVRATPLRQGTGEPRKGARVTPTAMKLDGKPEQS